MGIFRMGKDIINSNINAILDKAEEPEKMIKLMMQELEDTIIELKSSITSKMAARAKTGKDFTVLEDRVKRWTKRAEMAVSKGMDELAREALVEKKKAQSDLNFTKKDIEHLSSIINESKNNILSLEEKLQTVIQKHKVLIQRAIHAEERKEVNRSLKIASGVETQVRFDEFENKIERMEAEAEITEVSTGSLESEFKKMESGNDIDAELEALKKAMKKGSEKKGAKSE